MPQIGDVIPKEFVETHTLASAAQLARLARKYRKPERRRPEPVESPDSNGYDPDRVVAGRNVDWTKQSRLEHRLGPPNHQPAGPTPGIGRQVSGAGMGTIEKGRRKK